jgi:tetratricopeptide (TPR) repeat protein
MSRKGARAAGTVLALAALGASLVGLQIWRDATYGEPRPGDTVLYVRSGEAMRRLALGFSPLLADVYWVRAVQYFGGTRLSTDTTKRFDLLYPLLDIATSLDPRFNIAYRFGSLFLAEAYPGGAGRPDQAILLLEKGFRANPWRWHYLQDIGFVYYWWLGDYRRAGDWFKKASEIPGAPWWLQSLTAATYAQGGDRESSRRLWQAMHETADNEWMRNSAAWRLAQLDALDQIDRLAAATAEFRARTGAPPASWDDMVRARLLPGIPLDPSGVPFVFDPRSGTVTLSPESRLNPLPVGPQAARAAR